MEEATMKPKRQGAMIGFDTFYGADGKTYLVFKRTPRGGYHVFAEVEAKEAARKCGSSGKGTTDHRWGEPWKARAAARRTEGTTWRPSSH
jgi:hypothetical protein